MPTADGLPHGRDLIAAVKARGFVEVEPTSNLAIDLRYASPNNFTGETIYGGFDRLILHPIAAEALARASDWLARHAPGRRLLVLDGLRPNRIQRLFWARVVGGPLQSYVADPALGSVHGYGLAVDATLLDTGGRESDMGTGFDDFSPLFEPQREDALLQAGLLTPAQIGNRRLLRDAMIAGGFQPIALEWWHFDALPPDEVRRSFDLVE